MTRKELNVRIAAIITTLAETNGGPESQLYMFMDMNMDSWMQMRMLLESAGLITVSNYFVRLTEAGIKLAGELEAAIQKRNNPLSQSADSF